MSVKKGILETISASLNNLTKTEKKIAQAILLQPEVLIQFSLSELAQQLNVGKVTFIRFCHILGFKGYTDFKLNLAMELATQKQKNEGEFIKITLASSG